MKVWLNLLVLGALTVASARAERDIVYAARYYTPPGSHRTSHFHLYRINPDGTGKTQLTFDNWDEDQPEWTADGQHIRFIETDSQGNETFCEINAHGGRWRMLRALHDDGSDLPYAARVSGYRLENIETDNDPNVDQHILVNLKTKRRLRLAVPAHDDVYDDILPFPGHGLMYAANLHESRVGRHYLFYRLDTDTGALHYITDGQFLVWSPDGKYFCTAPGRDTAPYEKRKYPYPISASDPSKWIMQDKYRTVWAAPLYLRAVTGGPRKQLTPDLSWVTGADWRHR